MLEFRFNGTVYRPLFPDILRSLSFEERQDLEGSIKTRGVQVPVLVDEHDGIIDGLHRCITAEGCGIKEIPTRVLAGLSDEDKRALAVEINDCRRQQTAHEIGARRKTRAEKRAVIAAVVIQTPELSDRAIADKVKEKTGKKPSATTVGQVRKQLSSSGKTGQLPRTRGKDGKSRPSRRKGVEGENRSNPTAAESKPQDSPPRVHCDHQDAANTESVEPRSAPTDKPRPKSKPYDWSGLGELLSGPRAKLEAATASVRLLAAGGGDPSLIPGRLEGVVETLCEAADQLQEAIKWHQQSQS